MVEHSKALWRDTNQIDYMSEEGRNEDPSYTLLNDHLAKLYPDTEFTLLDCGIMSGVIYSKLKNANQPVDYTGIDINRTALEACRAKHPEARWLEANVTDLAFSNGSFDVVNCRHLLEHLPYYETAVREIFRVARRYVIICFFQPPRDPEVLLRHETDDGYIWLNRYAPGRFESLLERLSMTVEKVETRRGHRPSLTYFCTKA